MTRENPLSITMSKAVMIGALLCTTSAMAAIPQPNAPQGAEFPVNTVTAHAQTAPVVAADAAGDYVVVWTSDGEDGDGLGVFAQLYHADGSAVGGEIPVGTTTAGDQSNPKVAMDATGDFVVVWTSSSPDGLGVFARRFKADGTPASGELAVDVFVPGSGALTGDRSEPSVGMNATGRFVVAWTGPITDGQDDFGFGTYARIYDDTGAPVTDAFMVNNVNLFGDQTKPSVAMDAAGDFIVAYSDMDEGFQEFTIEANVFDRTGAPIFVDGSQGDTIFTIVDNTNNTSVDDQSTPSAAMDAAGDFVVVWQGPDADGEGVFADRYNIFPDVHGNFGHAGVQQINTTTAGDQAAPSVASDAAGDFVVTWISSDADGTGITARRYGFLSFAPIVFTPVSDEFAVNTTTIGDQSAPAVALDAAGDMVAVWQGPDADQDGIHGQRFARMSSLDLSAALVVAPTGTVQPGSSVALTASVTNGASASTLTGISTIDAALTTATSVEADISVPLNATGVSGNGDGWSCDALLDGVLPCHYAPGLKAGAVTPSLTVSLALPSVSGVQAFDNDAFGAQPDASIANNSASAGVTADSAPVANDGTLTVAENSRKDAGKLAATDADGDALTFSLVGAPTHGTVTVNADGSYSYTPAASFSGTDSFTFKANDGLVDSNVATLTITVTHVNHAPVAAAGKLAVDRNTTKTGTVTATDADGDALTYKVVKAAANGTVTLQAKGTYSYKPAAGFSGADSFTFRANDGTANSNVATVSITVTEHAPVAEAQSFSMTHNTAHSGTLKATDADAGDKHTFGTTTAPKHGKLVITASTGAFSYTPTKNFTGKDSFVFNVSDGAKSDTATVSITVK